MGEFNDIKDLDGKNLIVLSPHSDDPAFSVGGLLQNPGLKAAKCLVMVFFSESSFTPGDEGDIDPAAIEKVSRLRKSEDVAFQKRIAGGGAEFEWLGFKDAPLRGYRLGSSYQSGAPLLAYDLELAWAIAEMVAPNIFAETVILAPLALGAHIDHRITRTAALAVRHAHEIELLLYEDMPYATELGAERVAEMVAEFAKQQVLTLTPAVSGYAELPEQKEAAIRTYSSQVVEAEAQAILDYASALSTLNNGVPSERLWRVDLPDIGNPLSAPRIV